MVPIISILCLLLALPGCALYRLFDQLDWSIFVLLPLAVSTFAFLAYRSDKRAAEAGRERIPESTLHLLSLLGGWPGAFLAQRIFRHKTAKLSFQFVFWSTVLLHEYLAADFLLSWRLTRSTFDLVRAQFA